VRVVSGAPTWLTVSEAAFELQVSSKTIYRLVAHGQLRAWRLGGRKALRFLPEWIREAGVAMSTPVEVHPRTEGR
jgi:excisionase family DNA binding protein